MARIFMDGFESGGRELWTSVSVTPTNETASTYGMNGNYCLKLPGASSYVSRDLGANYSELYIAMRYRITSSSPGVIVHFKDSAGTMIFTVDLGSSLEMELRRGAGNATILRTSTKTLVSNTTYLIEIYYKPLNANGLCTVKVNGLEFMSIIAGDAFDTTIGLENIRHLTLLAANTTQYFDDFIVDDANWIGQTFIQGIAPTGAGATTQWTPSTGSNYACVDEVPGVDTDFNSTNATGSIDTFVMANLTGTINSIKCVQVQSRSLYEGTPTPTHQQLVVRSGGANYPSADKSPGTVVTGIFNIWATNPADSQPWEEADVNGIEAGVKATA